MSTRLSGHELQREGKPYQWDGSRYTPASGVRGKGLCSCGATSKVTDVDNERKRWHRSHKDTIRAQSS